MLADERPVPAQRLDRAFDQDSVVGQLAAGPAGVAEQDPDAAVDVELGVAQGRPGPRGQLVQLGPVLAQQLPDRLILSTACAQPAINVSQVTHNSDAGAGVALSANGKLLAYILEEDVTHGGYSLWLHDLSVGAGGGPDRQLTTAPREIHEPGKLQNQSGTWRWFGLD